MAKAKAKEKLTPIPKPRAGRSAASAPREGARQSEAKAPDLTHIAPGLRDKAVRTDSIEFYPGNPHKHDEAQIAAIRASLREHGQVHPLLLSTAKSPPQVVCGNGRLQAALAEGWEYIAAHGRDMTDQEAAALVLLDNRIYELSPGWEEAELRAALEVAQTSEQELADVLEKLAEEEGLLPVDGGGGGSDNAPEAQIDRAEELREKWGVQPGQLWIIPSKSVPGKEHRLLCGDSTKAEDVARVMGGERAGLCFTSPPYAQQRDYTNKIGDWDALMQGVFGNLPMEDDGQVLVNLGIFYSKGNWCDYWSGWIEWMKDQGWRAFGWYVWDKLSAAPGDWCGRCDPAGTDGARAAATERDNGRVTCLHEVPTSPPPNAASKRWNCERRASHSGRLPRN